MTVDVDAVELRLRVTDPQRWHAHARAWRQWADMAGHLAAEFGPQLATLRVAWAGAAAHAAIEQLGQIRLRLVLFRLLCWQADQVLSEFAAALERAKSLLTPTTTTEPAALSVAAHADATAAELLRFTPSPFPLIAPAALPDCSATPATVRNWWQQLAPAQQRLLLATEPGWLASLDGIPTADRDAANRLLLDDQRARLDQEIAEAPRSDRDRLRGLRRGLDALADRLDEPGSPRAYLLRLDLAGDGRTVVAFGDPDRASNVLTYVPGMTAELASSADELTHAERVAVRAAQLDPTTATSTVLWLDYDAPNFVDEAASSRQAVAAAPGLRRFQEGLRATHVGAPARQTVLGHSYGSLVVGEAAATAGPPLATDNIVFVGSPGVGVRSADALHLSTGHVWSSTARCDVIQYAALAPNTLARDLLTAATVPVVGPLLAFGRPARELWFGPNPSDPAFGARVFASQPDAGHLGYWDPGRPALDALTAITLGRDP